MPALDGLAKSKFQIREMCDADLTQVVPLWEEAGVSRPWNDPGTDIAFARKSPHSTILVGVVDDSVVATAMVGEDGHRGWVYYVATSPQLQNAGIGRSMMVSAEAWLVQRGIWKLQLLVRADNERAKGFYERLGYKDTGSICFQKVIGDAAS
ncbi:GNAT family acetyltransferase [Caulobacter sp. KR2-114]|uniref:GNAT family acetyltransferase n=1 Tax=Caulobacter sp. KR2-114 TaxID=3400912 RepID=UPI003C0034EB